MHKLPRSFFLEPATTIAPKFLGKYLVYNSPHGRVSGKIIDVEAYPAFSDDVSHGNKKTRRTEVMYQEGGYVYVYLIYGIHYQFAVVVNKKNVPEVVFIRAVVPEEGTDIMRQNFGREVRNTKELTKSPGNLCRSFGIKSDLYGADLTKDTIFVEDRGAIVKLEDIYIDKRVGISNKLTGSQQKLRYFTKS